MHLRGFGAIKKGSHFETSREGQACERLTDTSIDKDGAEGAEVLQGRGASLQVLVKEVPTRETASQ
jgi:hypothetical protein